MNNPIAKENVLIGATAKFDVLLILIKGKRILLISFCCKIALRDFFHYKITAILGQSIKNHYFCERI